MKLLNLIIVFVLGSAAMIILSEEVFDKMNILAYRLVVLFLVLIATSNLGGKLLVVYFKNKK